MRIQNNIFSRVKANTQRLDEIEQILNSEYENEKVKIKQNQERLDRIEQLLESEYQNEKLKIKQNQERLDRIERTNQRKAGIVENLSFLNKITNSQSGEDAIVAYVLARLEIPFDQCAYLDLGANRPVEGSNTHFLYTQGARGVLVEANPELIPALKKERQGDIILNRCIDTISGSVLKFYIMTDDGLSTTDPHGLEEIKKINPGIELKEEVDVESITINEIFENYFEKIPEICSIDVEGKDLDIIQSINYEQYRPLLIIVEMIEYSDKLAVGEKKKEIGDFMQTVGYEEYAFTGINSIFIDKVALKDKWNY